MHNPAFVVGGVAVASVAVISFLTWPEDRPAAMTQVTTNIPDFSGTWTRAGENPSTFEPPPDGPSAIMTAVPHYGHCIAGTPGGETDFFSCPEGVSENRESNAWVADYTNPILQPWTREALKKNADGEEAGIAHMSFQQNCKPSGVPQILNLRYNVQLLQSADVVMILYENNQQVRRVYMNQAHPKNLKPSWYGHSVGHYEGDMLVVDTVGQLEITELDRFGTLHSDQLHVVERYRVTGPDSMEVIFTVDDPKAFTMPWRGKGTYDRTHLQEGFAFPEYICPENNRATNLTQKFDIPTDVTADF